MSLVTRYASKLTPRHWLILSVVAIIVLQTLLFIQSARTRGFATGDGGVKLWQVQGIVQSGNLIAPIAYPGLKYDPEHRYSPFVPPWFLWQDNQPYSEYTSPFIWLSVPLYAWFHHAGLLILPWLSGVGLVLLAAWLAWRVMPNGWAALVPLAVGLSTPLPAYSMEFWEHTPGACLTVAALACTVKAQAAKRPAWWLMLAGGAIGLGLTMRAELYVYPVALAIGVVLMQRFNARFIARSIGFLALGGLLVAGPWWLFQIAEWGSPFGPRLQQNVPVLGGEAMLSRLGDTTGHNYVMLWPVEGAGADGVALLLIGAVLLAVIVRVVQRGWPARAGLKSLLWWLLAIDVAALAALSAWRLTQEVRPNDLLTTFPLVLLMLLPLAPQARFSAQNSRGVRLLLITSLTFVLLVLIISPFEGGIQWGPRFLLPVSVPLAVVIAARLPGTWRPAGRAASIGLAVLAAGLFIAGSYSTWNGVQFMRQGQIASEFMSAVIGQSAEQVVVADAWFLPQAAPYTFADKIWLMAETEDEMFFLIQQLRKQTAEPGFVYVSALTWAHIDPAPLLGPRIRETDVARVYVNAPTQYIEISRYLLLK